MTTGDNNNVANTESAFAKNIVGQYTDLSLRRLAHFFVGFAGCFVQNLFTHYNLAWIETN